MITKIDFNVMECIENIYKHSKNSMLESNIFLKNPEDFKQICAYLEVNEIQATIFSIALITSYESANFSEIFKYLGLKEFKILRYQDDIDQLLEKKLFIQSKNRKTSDYQIPKEILSNIAKNVSISRPDFQKEEFKLTLVDILEEFDEKSDEFDFETIDFYELNTYLKKLCTTHSEMPFFKMVRNLKLTEFELFFVMDTIWDSISRGDNDFNTNIQSTINDFYKQKSAAIRNMSNIVDGNTKLTKCNLIELSKDQYKNKITAKVSDYLIDFLRKEENIIIDNFSETNKRLIQSGNIQEKKLFYNPAEASQIQSLIKILEDKKFKSLQNKLKEKTMPIGIAVLLHGSPGTGKTETVYQIAKKTGRNIFKVDISETKSMWFGESQKIIKKVFTDYQEMMKTEENCPILLFNEADAIIGKRKSVGSSHIDETENAIQNIILEEMENFEGILFATTNLVENMDAAFERRFLFKIKFENPSLENSAKIWQSKIPQLNKKESLKLAEHFRFSGGEMENVTRKTLMNELLTNEKPSFEKVFAYCKEERWSEKPETKKIGFGDFIN